MSFTLTYTELKAAMRSWASDDDPEYVAELDNMIDRGELRVLKDLDLEVWEQDLDITISAGSRTVTKPTGAVYIHTLFIRDPSTLKWKEIPKRSFEFCRMYAPIESVQAEPDYFAEADEDDITVVPTPASTYSSSNAKARCTVRPTKLTDSGTTTWMSTNHPDLLFQACMIEAYDYLKHPAKLQEAASKYQSLLPGISKEAEDTIRRRYRALNSQIGADS